MTRDFQLCDGVLTFSESRTVIKNQEFSGRDDIIKVIIPPSVRHMEEEAFAECENLEEVVVSEGLSNLGVAAFTSCGRLRRVSLPSTLRVIEEGTFLFCSSLARIALPQGLEELRDLCFQGSGIEEIVIPEKCRYIGEEAFFECENLHRADVLNPDAFIAVNAFGSCYNLLRGYIAPGFPADDSPVSRLLYTMLCLSCPEKHSEKMLSAVDSYVKSNLALLMERILKYNNIPALTGMVSRRLLAGADTDKYLRLSLENNMTEISALLLKAKGTERSIDKEFEL